ncbi:Histidinol dehydrogenase [Pseudobythopirellula maris]|uniref:Histidinol dehydrogenase n=1 Tax=Pseudobythopirellula maris TaxID=2527991 RepID=A0A5C5ZIW6_9BACT|nr:histidinol dehydrogenase [Pseudobythopirellula maris]TWT86947.1 Histidinol dehydrogenase [Pseudobythopirellula maris]
MKLKIARIDARRPESLSALQELRHKLAPDGNVVSDAGRRKTIEVFGEPLTPTQVVERICDDVRDRGVEAALEYGEKLDGARLAADELRVPAEELAAAHAAAEPEFLETVRRLRANILRFQSAILHTDVSVDLPGGGSLRQRYLPLERVGLCVPGGAAAYPSTVLMTAVPAQAAGVKELAVVAPPTKFGSYNTDLLATCHELGIDEVYRVGGAQAVAAMAYGLDPSPPQGEGILRKVDKIVGPGNLFVALAKRHVYGTVDIDSIAGPSEVIVIADQSTPARYAAADLIAQAEHAPGSAVLVTWHEPLIEAVAEELEKQLAELSRGELAKQSLEAFGALITVGDRAQAARLCDELATEHLHLACEQPQQLLDQIRCAGAVFMGPHSPVPVGDYAAGPSHVLPTGATARFASGLSSNDFLRSNSVIEFTAKDLKANAEDIVRIAEKESLTAHAAAVSVRLE